MEEKGSTTSTNTITTNTTVMKKMMNVVKNILINKKFNGENNTDTDLLDYDSGEEHRRKHPAEEQELAYNHEHHSTPITKNSKKNPHQHSCNLDHYSSFNNQKNNQKAQNSTNSHILGNDTSSSLTSNLKAQQLLIKNIDQRGEDEQEQEMRTDNEKVLLVVCSQEKRSVEEERDDRCDRQNQEYQQGLPGNSKSFKSVLASPPRVALHFIKNTTKKKNIRMKDSSGESCVNYNDLSSPMDQLPSSLSSTSKGPKSQFSSSSSCSRSATTSCDTIIISHQGKEEHDDNSATLRHDSNEEKRSGARPGRDEITKSASSSSSSQLLRIDLNEGLSPSSNDTTSNKKRGGGRVTIPRSEEENHYEKTSAKEDIASLSSELSVVTTRGGTTTMTNASSSANTPNSLLLVNDDPPCSSSNTTSNSSSNILASLPSFLPASEEERTPHQKESAPPARRIITRNSCHQLLDDIDCGTGLVFLDVDNGDDEFLNRYLCTPGVRLFKDHNNSNSNNSNSKGREKQKSKTKKVNSSNTSSSRAQRGHGEESASKLYKSRGKFLDVSVNLGCHQSSAAAAAAVDIANVLFWGGENEKPLYVLTLGEIEKALKAAGVNDIRGVSDMFQKKFNEEHKALFETYVENALCSIGGKDDDAAGVLCCLEKFKNGKKNNAKPKRRLKHASHENQCKKRKKKDKSDFLFDGEHVIYEVDNDGKFSWRKSSESI